MASTLDLEHKGVPLEQAVDRVLKALSPSVVCRLKLSTCCMGFILRESSSPPTGIKQGWQSIATHELAICILLSTSYGAVSPSASRLTERIGSVREVLNFLAAARKSDFDLTSAEKGSLWGALTAILIASLINAQVTLTSAHTQDGRSLSSLFSTGS